MSKIFNTTKASYCFFTGKEGSRNETYVQNGEKLTVDGAINQMLIDDNVPKLTEKGFQQFKGILEDYAPNENWVYAYRLHFPNNQPTYTYFATYYCEQV